MRDSLIFLHGGSGFIGRNLQSAFMRLGWSFLASDSKGHMRGWCPECGFRVFQNAKADIYSASTWSGRRLEIVIDLASPPPQLLGKWLTDRVVKDAAESRWYVGIDERVMPDIRRAIYISSGGAIYYPLYGHPHSENSPRCVNSNYALSKIISENCFREQSTIQAIPYLILRPSNPYGGFQNPALGQGVVATWIEEISRGEPPVIFGDGSMVRDYIYVDDLVSIIVKVLCAVDVVDSVINVGTGVGTSLNQLANLFRDLLKRDLNFKYQQFKERTVDHSVMDTTHLLDLFPGLSFISLRDGIRQALVDHGIVIP